MGPLIANSEEQNDDTYGVLKLTLHPTSYDWEFVPIAGSTYTDSGTGDCVDLSGVGGFAVTPEARMPADSDDGMNVWAVVAAVIGASAAFVLTGAAALALLRSGRLR
jgi:hypothetical protein